MGLFDAIKQATSNAPLDFKGHCPVCNKSTQQTQIGVLGQAHTIQCKKCGSEWRKDSNGNWVQTR